MFNYNVINPVNIHYRKYPQNEGSKAVSDNEENKKPALNEKSGNERRFPNGNKVAIDYTKNSVNISQILQDFKSTIAAINTPDDIKEEVEAYLDITNKESLKNEPSREIILSNLKNAARVTDKYIQESLKKPSRVVQDWVDALFLQQVNLKSDPKEINEEFRVNIPKKTPQPTFEPYVENYVEPKQENLTPLKADTVQLGASQTANDIPYKAEKSFIESSFEPFRENYSQLETPAVAQAPAQTPANTPATSFGGAYTQQVQAPEQNFIQENGVQDGSLQEISQTDKWEFSQVQTYQAQQPLDLYASRTENEALAKETLAKAKESFSAGKDVYSTLKLYDEALELLEGSQNPNLKSAVYFERGKVFDSCDYAELALIDFHKATKCEDGNLKAQAHIKMGNIYDDYVQFDPAMDQYSKAIECSEEVNNLKGKTRALRYIAGMFTKRYDADNMEAFTELALESARDTKSANTISKTYLEAAENYKYLGEDSKALHVYGQLAQEDAVQDDYDTLAKNYMEASALMDKKGNKKKSYALMLKAKEFQRLARLNRAENA